jgi:hypothetical protein
MKKAYLFLAAVFYTLALLAQDVENETADAYLNTDAGAWYTSPWVWVLGAAIFILLLVALTKQGNRK